ncbi:MAG: hypothetical protein IMW89_03400 [Ktedonobacteraceae bacterium]|nr:hypothetical protein [Ktedonobacteraceae bacterium]
MHTGRPGRSADATCLPREKLEPASTVTTHPITTLNPTVEEKNIYSGTEVLARHTVRTVPRGTAVAAPASLLQRRQRNSFFTTVFPTSSSTTPPSSQWFVADRTRASFTSVPAAGPA